MIVAGECLSILSAMPPQSVHCCITSPPYWGLRAYQGDPGMIGLEPTLEEHIERLVAVFRQVRRVLRDDGTLWLNYGDAYATAGSRTQGRDGATFCGKTTGKGEGKKRSPVPCHSSLKPKDLMMIPARVALALQSDGWWLRSEIIWHKPNPMPESVTDRPTSAHEKLFLLSKRPRYFYDAEAVRVASNGWNGDFGPRSGERRDGNGKGSSRDQAQPMANLRNVWQIPVHAFSDWTETYRLDRVSADELSDDKMHIVSQDCPQHGGQADRVPKAFCGEHVAGETNRILRKHGRPFRARAGVLAPIDPPLDGWSLEQNSDCFHLSCSPAAIVHSNESHKKVRDPLTSPSCSVSSQSSDHTEHNPMSRENGEPCDHKSESSILPDDSGAHLLAQTEHHSASKFSSDKPPCICEIYEIKTKKTSHFATFPPALVEPCIKAGTSQKGVCGACGAPWVRQVEKKFQRSGNDRGKINEPSSLKDGWEEVPRGINETKTLGWHPSCACSPNDTKSAVVLDPFGGAGTVALVAQRLGRKSICIEISPEYARMAQARCERDLPLTWQRNTTDPDSFQLEFTPA